jgi:hypothetical protein
MDALIPFLSILGALALGAVSPGPSWIDRAAGIVMGALGLRLLIETAVPG